MFLLKEKIIQHMEAKNLSIAALERKAGLSIHSVRNLLKGKIKKPNINTLQAISEVLGCTLSDLLESSWPHERIRQAPKIASKPAMLVEDYNLLRGCFDAIASHLETERIKESIPLHAYFQLLEIIYRYSLRDEEKVVDHKFVKWVVENWFEEKEPLNRDQY